MIVSNSSPLIYLARADRLDLLKTLFRKVAVPRAVCAEVVERGLELEYPDALRIKRAIDEGWLVVENVETIGGTEDFGIHPGEAEAIALAAKRAVPLLADDRRARQVAASMGVVSHGTVYVLLLALEREMIDRAEFVRILNRMVAEGFRLGAPVYARVMEHASRYK